MDFALPPELEEIRGRVRELCSRFPPEYWRELEPDHYPEAFVAALTDAGWLGALVPEAFGGGGRSLAAASVILEEISASGGNPGACHAQMYVMGIVLRHGSDEQKARVLPGVASGELRLQVFAVTEEEAGSDTPAIATTARRDGDGYVVSGRKLWTSRIQHSDLMILLARTTPLDQVAKRTHGLSVFLVDLREAAGALDIRPIRTLTNHATTELVIDGLRLGTGSLIGEEGQGFRYLLEGMNSERMLVAAECVGDGRYFVERAVAHAGSRVVFGRAIGSNQGVAFPLARAHMAIEAANLMRWKAIWLYERGEPCGAEANMAKYLGSEASWAAANACMDAHGGFAFAAEHDIERKFRETRVYSLAPVSNNLIQAYVSQHVLGLPRSY
jgi:acyl-CoA dehydrogenase